MAPERPFPAILIETGKSHPKTGLFPAVSGRFSGSVFPSGFPAVFQRFASGFPASFRQFSGGSTAIFRQHASPGSTPRSDSGPSPSSERNVKKRRQFRTHFHAYKPSIAAFSKVCS